MGLKTSFALAVLSALNPGLGLLGSMVKFIVDERSRMSTLVSALAGIALDVQIDFEASPAVAQRLISILPRIALDAGIEAMGGRWELPSLCSYCGSSATLPIVDSSGKKVCHDCLQNGARRLKVPQATLENLTSTRSLCIADPGMFHPSSGNNFRPRYITVRTPIYSNSSVIDTQYESIEVIHNKVSTPYVGTRYFSRRY